MIKYLLDFKELIYYILVPLIISLIIFDIVFCIIKKKMNNGSYQFKKAYFGNLIYLTFSAMLLSCSVGFSSWIIKNIIVNELVNSQWKLLVSVIGLMIVTTSFFLVLLYKFLNVIQNEKYYYEESNEK